MKADYSATFQDEAEFERQRHWWAGSANALVCREIASRIPAAHVVLDAGAGSGAGIPYWQARASKVYAVDSCKRAVDYLLTTTQDVTVCELDLRKAELLPKVDTVVCKAVLKHFGPDDWRLVLRNLCEVARSRVIFTMNVAEKPCDRNPEAPYYDWAEPLGEIVAALPQGWQLIEIIGVPDPAEPIFVVERES